MITFLLLVGFYGEFVNFSAREPRVKEPEPEMVQVVERGGWVVDVPVSEIDRYEKSHGRKE